MDTGLLIACGVSALLVMAVFWFTRATATDAVDGGAPAIPSQPVTPAGGINTGPLREPFTMLTTTPTEVSGERVTAAEAKAALATLRAYLAQAAQVKEATEALFTSADNGTLTDKEVVHAAVAQPGT